MSAPLETPARPGPHQGQPVARAGAPLEEATAAMILVHGRGATATSILELGHAFGRSEIALQAPQAAGHTWYPYSFIAPLAKNEPGISSGLAAIGERVEELVAAGIPHERIVFAGFSQGACLASTFVARNPRRWGGLMVFSGGLIGPLGMEFDLPGDLAGTPAFMGCSDRDAHIPLERFEQTGQVLERMGADVQLVVYPGMPHTIIPDEIERAMRVLEAIPSA